MTFMGGFVAALNMSLLLSHNPDYEAGWAKVALATAIAIGGAFLSTSNKVTPSTERRS